MNTQNQSQMHRRGFIGSITAGAAAVGLSAFTAPLNLAAKENFSSSDPEDLNAWFKKIKGKHRIVFDSNQPHQMFTFAWPRVFLMTNAATGTPEKDCSVVVVLRHEAIPYALQSSLWEKYKLGEVFKIDDPATKQPATRNPFWQPKAGDYKVPGVGNVAIGINELQDSGVMFCACDVALTVGSASIAGMMNADPAAIKKEWADAVFPGIQIVPSGLWAVGRAQEHGCGYCYAG